VDASTIEWGEARIGRNRDAYGDLYALHVPGAVTVAYLMTGNRPLAEDLAQEAFVKIMGRFADRRPPEAFAGYLRKTVINLCRSHHRKEKVRRTHLESSSAESMTTSPPADPDDELRPLLLRLPHLQRAAIVLRFYEDLSESQTAELLECSEGAVRSAVFRGMKTLRDKLGAD
jgi:RNA polymerase sigma factor (sigma-70 family)